MCASTDKTIVSLIAQRVHSRRSSLSFGAWRAPFKRCCSFWSLSCFVWFCFSLEENISYRYKFKTLAVTFLAFTAQPPDTPEKLSFLLCLPSFPHKLLCTGAPAVVTVRWCCQYNSLPLGCQVSTSTTVARAGMVLKRSVGKTFFFALRQCFD